MALVAVSHSFFPITLGPKWTGYLRMSRHSPPSFPSSIALPVITSGVPSLTSWCLQGLLSYTNTTGSITNTVIAILPADNSPSQSIKRLANCKVTNPMIASLLANIVSYTIILSQINSVVTTCWMTIETNGVVTVGSPGTPSVTPSGDGNYLAISGVCYHSPGMSDGDCGLIGI